jgi:hypothetical protein
MLKMRRVPTSCCYRSEKHSFVRCLRAHPVYNYGKQTGEIELDLIFECLGNEERVYKLLLLLAFGLSRVRILVILANGCVYLR